MKSIGADTKSSFILGERSDSLVDSATLEMWYTRKGIVGSNPTLSASLQICKRI